MKKMKRAAMLLGCLCMLCFTALHIAAADVPDPTEDFYVNDYAGMLDTAAKDHIISINNKLYRDYDVQLVVVTVEDLNGEERKPMRMMYSMHGGLVLIKQTGEYCWCLQSVRTITGLHREKGWKSSCLPICLVIC